MEVRNKSVYERIRSYIRGACDSSLDWGPGRPQFEDLLDFLGSQECVVDTVHWWEPETELRGEISKWMLSLSYSYQDRLGRLVWDEEVFDEIYERFENFLYSENLIVTSVSPLYLFGCDLTEPIELDTDVGIIPKEYDVNIKYLLNRFEVEGKHFCEDYGWCIYARRKFSKSHSKERASDDSEDIAKLEDVLMSLRLLHSGSVHAGPLCSDEASPFAGIHGGHKLLSHSVLKRLPADYVIFELYTLKGEEIERLQRIYNQLARLNHRSRKFLDIPLGRFHDSYERRNERDKLIDLCIALESLYVREKDELAYRLALRCAHFLERDEVKLEETFRAVKDIYDARSKIVHGTSGQPNEEQLEKLVTEAEEYVRRSICKLLSDIGYIDKISRKLQEKELHFLDKVIFKKRTQNYF